MKWLRVRSKFKIRTKIDRHFEHTGRDQGIGKVKFGRARISKRKDQAIGSKVHNRNDVKRAGKLLTQFRQRMMTDKLIVCFIFLVVVGIAFCIIFAAVNPENADDLYILKQPRRRQLTILKRF